MTIIARIDARSGRARIVEPPTAGQGARRIWSDSRGRLWVTSTRLYPYPAKDAAAKADTIKVIELGPDGRAACPGSRAVPGPRRGLRLAALHPLAGR